MNCRIHPFSLTSIICYHYFVTKTLPANLKLLHYFQSLNFTFYLQTIISLIYYLPPTISKWSMKHKSKFFYPLSRKIRYANMGITHFSIHSFKTSQNSFFIFHQTDYSAALQINLYPPSKFPDFTFVFHKTILPQFDFCQK